MTNRTTVAVHDDLLKALLFPGLDCSIDAIERDKNGVVTFTISGPGVPPDAPYCYPEYEAFMTAKVRQLAKGVRP